MERQGQQPEQRTAAIVWPSRGQHSGKDNPPPLISQDNSSDDNNDEQRPEAIPARLPAYFPGPVRQGVGRVHSRSRPPANISQMALSAVLGRTLIETTGIYTPASLKEIALTFSPPCDIEEMVNGVVHPVTQERMTKYAAIIKVPEL